jgi:tRNA pseudouridine38-40 synthase
VHNYKLTIQYDGSVYAGWQIQENSNTVQGTISDAIHILLKEKVNLIGSGRTDSGVHALGQVANFRVDQSIDVHRFSHSLNSILPEDISITNIEVVDEKFHSRFDAKDRSYLYLVSKFKSPFYNNYSILKKNLNILHLNNIANELLGEHDFSSFCRKNSDVKNKNCKVTSIGWKETGNFYLFFISADRFLHGMVRTIVGTLLKVESLNGAQEIVEKIMNAKNREAAGETVAAKGLFLRKVTYL